MRERDFLNWIIAVAETTGWKVWHVPAPMIHSKGQARFVGSPRAAGLPDLFLLHDDPPRMIVAEVKGTGGKLSDKQREFLGMAAAIADIAFDPHEPVGNWPKGRPLGVYAWTPDQQDIIERILKSKLLI